MTDTLPNWGPARPMNEAPRDGTRILVWANVASDYGCNALIGPAVVAWGVADVLPDWHLSPWSPHDRLDGEPTGWWLLPEQTR